MLIAISRRLNSHFTGRMFAATANYVNGIYYLKCGAEVKEIIIE